jgi:hypothetical protein
MASKLGQWAFIIGLVIAIVFGLVPASYQGMLTLVLVVLGLVVGFLNITEKETTPFLVAAAALMLTANANLSVIPPEALGSFLQGAVSNIGVFVAPAAVVVAIKAIKSLAGD